MKANAYVCPACGWLHRANPAFGWAREDDRAVQVHVERLCGVEE